jgi:hypothetical protein
MMRRSRSRSSAAPRWERSQRGAARPPLFLCATTCGCATSGVSARHGLVGGADPSSPPVGFRVPRPGPLLPRSPGMSIRRIARKRTTVKGKRFFGFWFFLFRESIGLRVRPGRAYPGYALFLFREYPIRSNLIQSRDTFPYHRRVDDTRAYPGYGWRKEAPVRRLAAARTTTIFLFSD